MLLALPPVEVGAAGPSGCCMRALPALPHVEAGAAAGGAEQDLLVLHL